MRGFSVGAFLGCAFAAACGGGAAVDQPETLDAKEDIGASSSGRLIAGSYRLVGDATGSAEAQPFQTLNVSADGTFDLTAGAYAGPQPLAVAAGRFKLTHKGSTHKITFDDRSTNFSLFNDSGFVFSYTMGSGRHVKFVGDNLTFEMEPYQPTLEERAFEQLRVLFNNPDSTPEKGILSAAQLPAVFQPIAQSWETQDPGAVWYQEKILGKTYYAVNTSTDEEDPVVSLDIYDASATHVLDATSVGPGYPYTWTEGAE
jgi:hypothetical protein